MNDVFDSLAPEKKRRILDAAYAEFAGRSFRHASTDRIAREAGIAKGMLFYYFGSKKELFDFLIDYGMEYLRGALPILTDLGGDFVEACKRLSVAKYRVYTENLALLRFFGALVLGGASAGATPELLDLFARIQSDVHIRLMAAAEKSPLRDDIPASVCAEYIRWMLDGFEKKLISGLDGRSISFEEMKPRWDEFERFLGDVRKIFYK